jgi:hypothetical protein
LSALARLSVVLLGMSGLLKLSHHA